MTYLEFLLRWYNWLYVAALAVPLIGILLGPEWISSLGAALGDLLGFHDVSGRSLLSIFAVTLGIVGLVINGALHDYWSSAQEIGFLPGLVLSTVIAAAVTRKIGHVLERHFPEIRAVGFGSSDLVGERGRIVSQRVDADYRGGRAQIMDDEGTMHMVLCKSHGAEIPYGTEIELQEYDPEDRRYYVEPVHAEQDAPRTRGSHSGPA